MAGSAGISKITRERAARDEHSQNEARSTCRRCAVCGCGQRARRLMFDARIGRDLCDRHFVPVTR